MIKRIISGGQTGVDRAALDEELIEKLDSVQAFYIDFLSGLKLNEL